MWRCLVSAALVVSTSGCSYATMPRIDDVGPRGPGARSERPCTTSRLAPRFDTLWAVIGGAMFGEASAFAAAEMIAPERGPSPLSSEDTYEIALLWGVSGGVLLHYALKSRRHGYRMAARCEDDRHAEPAYCVVDQTQREPVASCTVELRPVALFHDR